MNHTLLSGSVMDESVCDGRLPECIVPTAKFGGGGTGLGPLVPMNTTACDDMLDKNVSFETGLSCFNMTNTPPCTKPGPQRNVFLSLVWMNLSGLHRATTSTPIQRLWGQMQIGPSCPTSVDDLTDAFVAEWQQISADRFKTVVENLPRRVEAGAAAY